MKRSSEERGKAPPRMGRPPLPKEKVRSHRVVTFVTEAERAQLEKRAREVGTSVSGLLHEAVQRSLAES